MTRKEHPVRQLLDAVAYSGSRPPAEELDALAADLIREDLGGTSMSAETLRRSLSAACDDIVAAHAAGAQGYGRRIAAETAEKVAGSLPEYRPAPDGRSIQEIVEAIPRGIG